MRRLAGRSALPDQGPIPWWTRDSECRRRTGRWLLKRRGQEHPGRVLLQQCDPRATDSVSRFTGLSGDLGNHPGLPLLKETRNMLEESAGPGRQDRSGTRCRGFPTGSWRGPSFRVLKVDETNNIVVLNFRMGPHTVTQRHDHHCTAMAYTLKGQWTYGDCVFEEGRSRVRASRRSPSAGHQGSRRRAADDPDRWQGKTGSSSRTTRRTVSTYVLGVRFFKAVERITFPRSCPRSSCPRYSTRSIRR